MRCRTRQLRLRELVAECRELGAGAQPTRGGLARKMMRELGELDGDGGALRLPPLPASLLYEAAWLDREAPGASFAAFLDELDRYLEATGEQLELELREWLARSA